MSRDAMAQANTGRAIRNPANSTRQLALARRKAMSSAGKKAIKGSDGSGNTTTAARKAGSTVSSHQTASASAYGSAMGSSVRAVSLARRKALSARGKLADTSRDRTRSADRANVNSIPASDVKKDCGCGCGGTKGKDRDQAAAQTQNDASHSGPAGSLRQSATAVRRRKPVLRATVPSSTAKAAALARRKAMSTRGKAGISSASMTEAQAARASNPRMTGRELAQVVREQRSRRGGAGQKKSAPTGRRRKASDTTPGAAQDAPWKVGASETASGQVVTGTMVGRKETMTGDEASTCRTITGTEYMGADIFSKFCETDARPATVNKVMVTTTSHGNAVTGNRMGRSSNVTGNEPGTCKTVTGGEYVSAEQVQGYCGEFSKPSPRKVSMAETMRGKVVTGNNVGRSESVTGDEYGMRQSLTGTQYTKPTEIGNAPSKVGVSSTLRGGNVTGTMVGRKENMTGDEAGSCRNVTGDDYIGKEQYTGFCKTIPEATDRKVERSQTLAGLDVTGSLAARSKNVTGDEPGTCKAVTGTPYAGADQYQQYCESDQLAEAKARMTPATKAWGKSITGQQPGVGGTLTGAEKGVCEPVSGTPYVGTDQVAQSCPATAAEPGSPDYPQSLAQNGAAAWEDFSVSAPSHASKQEKNLSNVTGSQYEHGHITGPFGKAEGRVTGTEQARFGDPMEQAPLQNKVPATAESIDGRVKTRISGEGMDAGQRITGDDWDRGNHVTGTEGLSATRRNPTIRRAAMNPMPVANMARAEDLPVPVSKVTGSSGNADDGSLITYSGGARG